MESPPPVVVFSLDAITNEYAILHTLGGTEIEIRFLTTRWGPGESNQPWLILNQTATVALLARAALKSLQDTANTAEMREQLKWSTFRVFKGDQELPPAKQLVSLIEPRAPHTREQSAAVEVQATNLSVKSHFGSKRGP